MSPAPPKTLLVTGGAGFIGSHLCDALAKAGHRVCCLDDLSQGKTENIEHLLNNPQFSFHRCDLLDDGAWAEVLAQLGPIDAIFHLAANSDIRRGIEEPGIDLNRTLMTTWAVLAAIRGHHIPQLVFASTSAVFGTRAGPLDEDTGPMRPISAYGAAKLASEAFVSAFAACYGIQTWILRFPNVVGPRSTHGVVHDFLRKLAATPEELRVLGDGRQRKPYLYVTELVEAMLFVWSRATEQVNCFHIAHDSTTTVARIAEIVCEELRFPATRIVYAGGDRGWVGDVPEFEYDLKRLGALGWHARWSSEEAIRLAVRAEMAAGSCRP